MFTTFFKTCGVSVATLALGLTMVATPVMARGGGAAAARSTGAAVGFTAAAGMAAGAAGMAVAGVAAAGTAAAADGADMEGVTVTVTGAPRSA